MTMAARKYNDASIRRYTFFIFIFNTSTIFIEEMEIAFPFTQRNAMQWRCTYENSMSIANFIGGFMFVMVQ